MIEKVAPGQKTVENRLVGNSSCSGCPADRCALEDTLEPQLCGQSPTLEGENSPLRMCLVTASLDRLPPKLDWQS